MIMPIVIVQNLSPLAFAVMLVACFAVVGVLIFITTGLD